MRFLPLPRSIRSKLVSCNEVFNSGVRVFLISLTGANAEIINDKGAVLLCSFPFASQTVRMDIESFPTGMQIPNWGHNSIPTA